MSDEPILNSQGEQPEMSPEQPAVDPTPVVAENATVQPSFLDGLSEDLRGETGLQDFKDANGLAKSYVNLQKMMGNSIRIPTEDSSAEAKQEFYNSLANVPGIVRMPEEGDADSSDQFYSKLGRPESKDGYTVEISEELMNNLPESMQTGVQTKIDSFLETAHRAGLTNNQTKAILSQEIEGLQMQHQQLEQSKQDAEASLREVWGHDYNNRLASAKAAAHTYAEKYPEAMQEIMSGPAGNNPALLSILADYGRNMQESGTLSTQSNIQFGMSSVEAQDKIQEIMDNKSHAYFNQHDPGHKAAVEKMRSLYNAAYGD